MSTTDLKHTLRKYDFPACAKEALIRTEQLLVGRGAPSSKQLDVAMDILAEFVFYESDRRGGRRGAGLTPLQELQLIDVLCEYLASCANEITKNTVFLSLFGGMEGPRRMNILSILASMAISASSTPVLQAVGVWLQQMGCSSPLSLQLAENIIRDHFFLNTSNQAELRSLATSAPQFVSNLMTCAAELYVRRPPRDLLAVVTGWVHSSPALCGRTHRAALPAGAIPMAPVTPLAGLIRWCTLAPLALHEDSEMVEVPPPDKKIKLEGEAGAWAAGSRGPGSRGSSERELYEKLHLGVLQGLRAARSQGPATAVSAHHLIAIAQAVQPHTHPHIQTCLDRLGQAVQVALANNCVYGNIPNLLSVLEGLPENRLLKIVVHTQRSQWWRTQHPTQ